MAIISDTNNVHVDNLQEGAFGTDLNVYEVAALGTCGLLALNGVAVITVAAPAYAGVMLTAGAGLAYAGDRTRKGLPMNPFTKAEETTERLSDPTKGLEVFTTDTGSQVKVTSAA
jgi:hypothetical protein